VFRRKKIQNVHRVEDLQEGDEIQYDLTRRATIARILEINRECYALVLTGIIPGNVTHEKTTVTLHRELKVFAWR
jgi:hypothetical protein